MFIATLNKKHEVKGTMQLHSYKGNQTNLHSGDSSVGIIQNASLDVSYPPPHTHTHQSGKLQSWIWMAHVVAALHMLAVMTGEADIDVPWSCGPPNKFHTIKQHRTETSLKPTPHTLITPGRDLRAVVKPERLKKNMVIP